MSCVCRPEADRECHREGGRLASIHSQDEMDFVAFLVKSARVQNPQYRPNIFIGLEQGGQGMVTSSVHGTEIDSPIVYAFHIF